MRCPRLATSTQGLLLAVALASVTPGVAAASWQASTIAGLSVSSLALTAPTPTVNADPACLSLTVSWAASPRANEYEATVKDLTGSYTYAGWTSPLQTGVSYVLDASSHFLPIGTTVTVTVQAFFYAPGQSASAPNWHSSVATVTRPWLSIGSLC